MIKFEFENEDYEINDEWEFVKAGKHKDLFEKDIRGFFMDFNHIWAMMFCLMFHG